MSVALRILQEDQVDLLSERLFENGLVARFFNFCGSGDRTTGCGRAI